ncbi:MAG TPA: TonB family protein [Longimicrobiales bacterium]
MRRQYLTIANALAALILVYAEAAAQEVSACDSTIVVDIRLAKAMDVRAEFADWIPTAAKIELLFEWPTPTNRTTVSRELVRRYPRHLLKRGIGGEVDFALLLDTTGAIVSRKLIKPSQYPEFDRAAEAIISMLRYDPVKSGSGCAVPGLLRMPIVFRSIP